MDNKYKIEEYKKRLKVICEYTIGQVNEEDNDLMNDDQLIDSFMLEEDEPDNNVGKEPPKTPENNVPPAQTDVKKEDKPEPSTMVPPSPEKEPEVSNDSNELEEIKNLVNNQVQKVTDIFNMMQNSINNITQKLDTVDQLTNKVTEIEKNVQEITPPTPEERLDLISKESFPYNLKLSDIWTDYFKRGDEVNNTIEDPAKDKEHTLQVNTIEPLSDREAMDSFNK